MIMNKTKLLSFAVLALLLLNFGILGFLFVNKDKERPRERRMPREIVIEQLHFDTDQIAAYDVTIKMHQNAIRELDQTIRTTKNELYQLLNSEVIDVVKKDQLINQLAAAQKQIETTHFNHFLDIKALCKKDQLDDYDNLTEELSKLFSHPRKP